MQKMMWGASMAALALTAPLAAQAADGDEPVTLSPVVIESATRQATPVDDVSRSVTVVTREQIEKRKLIDRSVGDILSQMVPGFSQSNEAATDYGLTLRGRTFLTMIDGVPQSTPARDGRRSLNTIKADAIERIEVVRGGTAAYGFGAAGGLVNIITKKGTTGTPTIGFAQSLGMSATHPADSWSTTTEADLSGANGDLDYLLSGAFTSHESFFDAAGNRIPANPFGGQGGLAESHEANILGKVGLNFNDARQRVQVTVNHYDMLQSPDWGRVPQMGSFGAIMAAPPEGYRTPAEQGSPHIQNPGTENTNLNLEYTHQDVLGSALSAQAYYADLDVTYGKLPPWAQTKLTAEKVGGRLTMTTPVRALPVPFDVVWGGDYLREDNHHFVIDGGEYYPPIMQDAYAAFGQVEAPVGSWGKISGGVRQEYITLDSSPFTYVTGAAIDGGTMTFEETLFNLTGTAFLTDHVDLFGGWSQGFTLGDIARSIGGNPFADLADIEGEAQRTQNYEAGLRTTHDTWNGSLVGFLSTSNNGTTFDTALNIRKTPERIWGVEAEGNIQATDDLLLGGTLTWMEGEADYNDDGTYEEDLPTERIAPWKITAHAEYAVFDWWTTRLSGLYSGYRNPNPGGSPSGAFTGSSEIEPYVVFDLYNSFAVGPGDLELGVKNLFNADYRPVLNQAYNWSATNAAAPGTTLTARYAVTF